MSRRLDRRSAVKLFGATITIGLAGCSSSGGNSETDDGSSGNDSGTSDSSADAFEYTFESGDSVVESSLTGIQVNYPDGSGALSEASVASVTLGGADVSGGIENTSSSNNGSSLTVGFGGNFDISDGDTLMMELADLNRPDGSYTIEVIINPQSGATSFERSF